MKKLNLIESLTNLGLKHVAQDISLIQIIAQIDTNSFETEKKVLTQVAELISYYSKLSLDEMTTKEVRLPSFNIETSTKIINYTGEPLAGLVKQDILSYAIPNFLDTFVKKYMTSKEVYLSKQQLNKYKEIKTQIGQIARSMQIGYGRLLNLKPSKKDRAILRKTSRLTKEDIQKAIIRVKATSNDCNAFDSFLIDTYFPELHNHIEHGEGSESDKQYMTRIKQKLKSSKLQSLKQEVEANVERQLDISSEEFVIIKKFVTQHVSEPEIKYRAGTMQNTRQIDSKNPTKYINKTSNKYENIKNLEALEKILEQMEQQGLEDTEEYRKLDEKANYLADEQTAKEQQQKELEFLKTKVTTPDKEDNKDHKATSPSSETPISEDEYKLTSLKKQKDQSQENNLHQQPPPPEEKKLGEYGNNLLSGYRKEIEETDIPLKEIKTLFRSIMATSSSATDDKGKIYSPEGILAVREFLFREWQSRYAALLIMAVVAYKRHKYQEQVNIQLMPNFIQTEDYKTDLNDQSKQIEQRSIQKLYNVVGAL